ncbi:MAG: tetratricopeptide repeat protein [Rhodopila sp.]
MSNHVDVDFFKMLAEVQRNRGQLDEAVKTLAKGAAIFSESYDMLWRYGHWLIDSGRHKDGLRVMGRAASICDDLWMTEGIVNMLVNFALSCNEKAVAVEALRDGANVSPHADCCRLLLDGVGRLSK